MTTTPTPVVTRRRPLTARRLNDIYPDLPEPIPSPSLPLITPHKVSIAQGRSLQNILEITPSPLRELEKGWKELRRRRLSEDRSIGCTGSGLCDVEMDKDVQQHAINTTKPKNNVRFTTSSSAALLTPPSTPPQSPKIPKRTPDPEIIRARPSTPINETATHHLLSTQNQLPKSHFRPKSPRPPATRSIKPITSYPLPPTPRPIPLIAGKKDLIYIPPPQPTSRYELILNLVGGRRIKVMREGEVVEYIPGKGEEKDTRILRMVEVDEWNRGDKRDWEVVSGIIEGFKRITPRIKIYHTLGQLCITCSSPPDIILSFRILSSSDVSSIISRQINNDSSVQDDQKHEQIKIRITYSKSTSELRIDSHFTRSGIVRGGKKEICRTKRIIPISVSHIHHHGGVSEGGNSIEDASVYMGIQSDLAEWNEGEKEGLRRLWDLRREWGRWEGG